MKAQPTSSLRYFLYAALAITATTGCGAATIAINSNPLSVSQGEVVAAVRLRASSNSWDMAISNGQSYEVSDARQTNLSRSFSSPGRSYDFTLQHLPGEGLVFTATDTRTGQTTQHAWGTFSDPVFSRNAAPTLGGQSPAATFNSLQIEARALIGRATTAFSDLLFTSSGLTSPAGSFYDGSITNTSVIGSNPRGTATQELLADVDLSQYAWTLSGNASFIRSAGAEGADDVSFTVNLRQSIHPASIPEPAGALLLLSAAGMALLRRRRA